MSTVAQQSNSDAPVNSGATTPAVPRPVGAAPATLPTLLVGLVLLALSVVAVREAVVTLGWASGEAWTPEVVRVLAEGVKPSPVVVVIGVVVALVGLWFLLRAFGRRPRVDLGLGGDSHAWIAPTQVCRVAALVAADVDGVVTSKCRPGRRSVKVRVVATSAVAGTVKAEVRDRVSEALAGLDPTPRVAVRVTTLGGS